MRSLPRGTITFLFTDIQGSTRLWELYPVPMRRALARHDALVAASVAGAGGEIVRSRGEGDSFFAVFADPAAAVAAALDLQLALHRESWPAETPIAVRIALHTGTAELRDGDYYGSDVNRCARLRAVAHGGQVLLSGAVQALAREQLPAGAALRDMGSHRLKDLLQAERVYQLLHPELPPEFPPLASLDSLPNNLPGQLTAFVGRERELRQVGELLARSRLVTLTGVGGCGKTRLALQAAAAALEEYPDGVWLVELAALGDESLIGHTIAGALRLREEPGRPLLDTVTEYLETRRVLLLLDNCEHVVQECAEAAERLLSRCPELRVLATSREALGIAGEAAWRVPSLGVPEEDADAGRVRESEAAALFCERAAAAAPEFRLTEGNASAVSRLCRRLDGLPLALELAAARVSVLTVEQIAGRLDDRFRLLTGGRRTALPRQQTLRALIDWSYDLLTPGERAVLRRLSVFAGGWGLEAAEAVCADPGAPEPLVADPGEVLDLLARLVDRSLVTAELRPEGEARYRLLETVRQYGRERLEAAGEAERARDRHRDWCLALAEEAEPHLQGPRQAAWLERLAAEHDNLRAGMEWCREGPEHRETRLRFGKALFWFWYIRGHLFEGRGWLDSALASPGEAGVELAARARNAAGILATSHGDYAAARAHLEAALRAWEELGDRRGAAGVLSNLGIAAVECAGDRAGARSCFERALPIYRELEDVPRLAAVLLNLGGLALDDGDAAQARRLLQESLDLHRELGDRWSMTLILHNLGIAALMLREPARSRACYRDALELAWSLGDRRMTAILVGSAAVAEGEHGDPLRAVRLYGASTAEQSRMGILGRGSASIQAARNAGVWSSVRAAMGNAAFEAALAAGDGLPLEAAVALALDCCAESESAAADLPPSG